MRLLVVGLLLLVPLVASAASPEQDYFAARDGYLKKFNEMSKRNINNTPELQKQDKLEEAARAELEKLLKPIVGPAAIKGLPAEGKINLGALSEGNSDYGRLDGMLYETPDFNLRVVVTTDAILEHWLRDHRTWFEDKPMPQAIDAALKQDHFYTQAIDSDAAVGIFATLPIAKPASASFAVALLIGRAQDFGLRVPDGIVLGVIKGARVFLVEAKARTKAASIPACDAIWKDYERRARKLQDSMKLEEEGDAAFRRCYAQRVQTQRYFAALTKEAQALVDLLPAR
jgi:hypothetical protein